MAVNYPTLPTLQSQTTAARQQGMDLGMQQMQAAAAAQSMRNQETERQMNLENLQEFRKNAQLRNLQRQTSVMEEQMKQRPEFQQMFQQQTILDAANNLSTAKRTRYQNAIDSLDPIVAEFKGGDPARAARMLQLQAKQPEVQAAIQDPNSKVGAVYRGFMSGNPQAMAEARANLEFGRAVVNAPAQRASKAEQAKLAQEQQRKIEIERVKGEEARKTATVRAAEKAQAEAQGKPPAVPSELELTTAKKYWSDNVNDEDWASGSWWDDASDVQQQRLLSFMAKAVQTEDKNKSKSYPEALEIAAQRLKAKAGELGGDGPVTMTAPDGTVYQVPADQVEEARSRGWK